MIWWQYAAFGACGGLAVELAEFYGAIRRTGGWPWRNKGEPGPVPLLVSVVIRVILGAGLAWVLGEAQQISGIAGAFTVGIAAPLILEQMGKRFPAQLEPLGDKPPELKATETPPPAQVETESSPTPQKAAKKPARGAKK